MTSVLATARDNLGGSNSSNTSTLAVGWEVVKLALTEEFTISLTETMGFF